MARAAKTVQDYKSLFQKARNGRVRYERDWYLNLSYFLGDQWVFWNRDRLDRPRVNQPNRVMLVDNRIQGIALTRIARKAKQRPTWVATPFSADQSDLDSSELAEKVLENDWITKKLTPKLHRALFWQEVAGAGIWKIYWDRNLGESSQTFVLGPDGQPVQHPKTGRPVRAEQMMEGLQQTGYQGEGLPDGYTTRDVAEGDVCVEVLTPFEFYPDPLATSMEDLEWAIECKVRSKDYLIERYGDKARSLKADAQVPTGGITASRFGVGQPIGGTQLGPPDYQGIKLYELWRKPCPDYPNGERVCWANDEVLERDGEPFDPMPYVLFGSIPSGSFWPTSVTTQLRGPQTELNKIKSQIRESANRIGNPALLWNRFNGDCDWTGAPGEVITYNSGTPDALPKFLEVPEIPVYVQNEIERVEAALSDIAGLHDASSGQVPAGVTAASAINLLQEADDTRLGPEVAMMEDTLAQGGTKIIRLHARYTDTDSMIRIAGDDGDWDIREFRGDALSSNVNVEVQSGSMMPRSKAAKQAAMTEVFGLLLQYSTAVGLGLDQRAIRGFFRDYEAGALDKLFGAVAPDENQIIRENRTMSQGQAIDINAYDNDDLHIAGHEEYQKSAKYDKLPPQVQQIFALHVAAHRERRVTAKQQQVADQSQAAVNQMQAEQQGQLQQGQQQIDGRLAQTALQVAAQQQQPEPAGANANGGSGNG